ncbi:MAG: hypothetical protein Q8P44_10555, partial [Dehalococcoidia bacterium]|nr:hypothetical protein [Dehalococcoidia bacterium]
FLEIRKKKKAANTELALKLVIKKLERLRNNGDDPSEILENAIRGSWKDVYPLDRRDNNNGTYKKRPGQIPKVYTEIPIVPIPD